MTVRDLCAVGIFALACLLLMLQLLVHAADAHVYIPSSAQWVCVAYESGQSCADRGRVERFILENAPEYAW